MNDRKMKPGEKGFGIFLLLLIIYLLVSSIQMFLDTPKLSSYGGYPLILSILLLILIVKVIFENRSAGKGEKSKASGNSEAEASEEALGTIPEPASKKSLKETIAAGLHYLLPRDVLVLILMLIIYSICLFFGFGFYPCTAVFLVAAMQYLKPDGLKWNLITAAVLLALIYVAFTVIFKVRLP